MKFSLPRINRRSDKIQASLLAVFFSSTAVLVYTLISAWIAYGSAISSSIPTVYTSGVAVGVSLYATRMLSYRKKSINFEASSSIAFFDVLAFFSVVGLVTWGVVFPLIRPVSQSFSLDLFYFSTLTLSFSAGLVLGVLIVVSRVALQPLVMHLSNQVTQLQKVEASAKTEQSLAERDSLILKELASIRQEISMIYKNGFAYPRNGASSASEYNVRRVEYNPKPVRPVSVHLPSSHTVVQSSEPPRSAGEIPDAAKDNPWAMVLAKRGQKQS